MSSVSSVTSSKSYFAGELLERNAVLLGVHELVAFGPANVKFAGFIPNEVWVDVVRVGVNN